MLKKFRSLFFPLILVSILAILGDLMSPKRYREIAVDNYHDEHLGMYEMERNTLDVLFIGSSHVFSSVSPEDIFNDYGITAYVQGSSCQKIWQSYYYLKETYYTQKPKVVVLDTFMALDGSPQTEAFNREAIDKMKLSPAKMEAIKTAVEFNSNEENFVSYLFPIFRYHDRWEELKQEDYIWFVKGKDSPTKGFLPRIGSVPATFNELDYTNELEESNVMNETCEVYLDKIKSLCEENGSTLILAKIPTCLWNQTSSSTISQWAEERKVEFLDYNAESKLREEVSIDWESDSLDGGNHLNYDGAMKFTKVFGKYLSEHFSFEDKREKPKYEKWKEDYIYYKKCVDNYMLANTADCIDYIGKLKNGDYVTLVSIGNINLHLIDLPVKLYEEFGISEEFLEKASEKNNLLVLQNTENIVEVTGEEDVEIKDTIAGVEWNASSRVIDGKKTFSCIWNKEEFAKEQEGVYFVVWDPVTQQIVDSVCMVFENEMELTR